MIWVAIFGLLFNVLMMLFNFKFGYYNMIPLNLLGIGLCAIVVRNA